MVFEIVQIAGSLLILTAFLLSLLGKVSASGRGYLLTNAVGSAVLTVTAVVAREWGFILLEGVWALASTVSLVRSLRGRESSAVH
jgi:hypothetical protein